MLYSMFSNHHICVVLWSHVRHIGGRNCPKWIHKSKYTSFLANGEMHWVVKRIWTVGNKSTVFYAIECLFLVLGFLVCKVTEALALGFNALTHRLLMWASIASFVSIDNRSYTFVIFYGWEFLGLTSTCRIIILKETIESDLKSEKITWEIQSG